MTPQTPFLRMFLLLFGETLASLLAFMVTVFFCFHVWLMLKAMTTIEFCEKSMKKADYNVDSYSRGFYGNIRAVLGKNPLLWLIPVAGASGDGMSFRDEETPLLPQRDPEKGERRQMAGPSSPRIAGPSLHAYT